MRFCLSARPPMAGHKRGRICWRPTSWHPGCWGICGAGQADHTLTVSQPHSSNRAIAPARLCDICGVAAHLGHVVARQGALPSDIDLAVFSEHLCTCRCPRAMGGRRNHHTVFGAITFRQHLVEIGVCHSAAVGIPCSIPSHACWLSSKCGCASTAGHPIAPSSSTLATPPD